MNNTTPQTMKRTKDEQAKATLAELLSAARQNGFYGTASLTLNIQDGHIQHLKVATERMIR